MSETVHGISVRKDFDDFNGRLLAASNLKQGELCRKIKNSFNSRLIEKFKMASKQLTHSDERGLYMPPLEKIRLSAKESKNKKVFYKFDEANCSFIIRPVDQAENEKVESALLSCSDNAEDQVRRALAGNAPHESYDFKLYLEILRSMSVSGVKVWRDDFFRKYSDALMNYFEFKTQSRHTDVGLMAGELFDFERVMAHADPAI